MLFISLELMLWNYIVLYNVLIIQSVISVGNDNILSETYSIYILTC